MLEAGQTIARNAAISGGAVPDRFAGRIESPDLAMARIGNLLSELNQALVMSESHLDQRVTSLCGRMPTPPSVKAESPQASPDGILQAIEWQLQDALRSARRIQDHSDRLSQAGIG